MFSLKANRVRDGVRKMLTPTQRLRAQTQNTQTLYNFVGSKDSSDPNKMNCC